MKKWLTRLGAAALLLALLTVSALAVSVLEKPANGYVADVAGVLDPETVEHMVSWDKKLAGATGGAIAVVTVDYLNGADIGDYAKKLYDAWGIGDAEGKNGILILLAVGEEDYYLLQGAGIAKDLPAAALKEYGWTYLERDFAEGNYDEGVHKLFDAFYRWYEDRYPQEMGMTAPEEPLEPDPAQTPAETAAPAPSQAPSAAPTPAGEETSGGARPAPGKDSGGLGPAAIALLVIVGLAVLVVALDGVRYLLFRRRSLGRPGMVYRPFIFGRSDRRRSRKVRPSHPFTSGYNGPSAGAGTYSGRRSGSYGGRRRRRR